MILPQESGPSDPEDRQHQHEEDSQRQSAEEQPRAKASGPATAIQAKAGRQGNGADREEQEVEHGLEAAQESALALNLRGTAPGRSPRRLIG